MANLAERLASDDENDKVTVLFHTIDDTVKQFTNRIVCIKAQEIMPDITLNMIKQPHDYSNSKQIMEARKYAYGKLRELVSSNRLIIKGGEGEGAPTLDYLRSLIKYYKTNYPDRDIVGFLDNFHRLRDFANKEERIRFKLLSNGIKDISKEFEMPIVCTMEYTKGSALGGKPDNGSISESAAMEYDANLICHLYNELHEKRDMAEVFFNRTDKFGRAYKAPRIEMIFGKNKINEFKGELYFDFYTEQSRFVPVPFSVVKDDIEKIRSLRQEDKKAKTNNNSYTLNNSNRQQRS